MKLVNCSVKNFKGLKDITIEFADRTLISGRNAVGKTSVRDAIFWVLTDKMSDGSSASSIKPHGADGNDIHHLTTSVDLSIDIGDHSLVTLGKTLTEKWVKHRGESETTYEGDSVAYTVNGIEKSAKDFKTICQQLFPETALLYGSNAKTFLNLDTKKRRAALMDMISGEEIDLLRDPKWDDIRSDLRFGTEDETILACKRQIKQYEEKIAREDASIEYLEDMLRDKPDDEEIEEQLEYNNRRLLKGQSEEDAIKKKMDDLTVFKNQLLDLDNRIMSEVKDANNESIKRRQELNAKILENQKQLLNSENEMNTAKSEIARLEKVYLQVGQKKIDTQKTVFDESTTICPVCGQKLPKKKIEELKQTFADQIADIVGKCEKEMLHTHEQLQDARAHRTVLETRIELLTQESEKLVDESQNLPSVDVEPTSERYLALKRSRHNLRKKIEDMESENYKDKYIEIRESNEQLRMAINHLWNMQNGSKSKSSIKNEIEVHQQTIDEHREVIGDMYRKIDLITQYQIEKINLLTEKINSHFGIIRWEMFKSHKDGSVELCCEPMVNGTSYYKGLNHGDRLLAEIDVCQAFQKASGCQMFVTLDDAESVDPERIPVLDNQVLVFRRTDDEQLCITKI